MFKETKLEEKKDVVTTQSTNKKTDDPEQDILKEAITKVSKEESQKKVRVTTFKLNIRKNAGTSAEVVSTVDQGDILTVSKTKAGAWYKVIAPVSGYAVAEFLEDVG